MYQINVVLPPDLAAGDHAIQAEIAGTRTQSGMYIPVQGSASASTIQVAYRLDPWLVSNNYQGALWVAAPVLGPATQGASTFAVEARAQGLDAQGQLVDISPQWTPADSAMVTVSPGQGSAVTITVLRAGQTSVRVLAPGVSKELVVKAVYRGANIEVEITQ